MLATKIHATLSPYPLRPGVRFAVAAACAALLVASSATARAAVLNVGNIQTFSTGSTAGNPAGTWTLDDKSWTYLSQSGFVMSGTGGPENIQIIDSVITNSHSFLLGSLGNLAGPSTFTLGYRVNVDAPSPFFLNTVELDVNHLVNNVNVYKDVFSTLSLFTTSSGTFGLGDLATLHSVNGTPVGPLSLAGGPTEVWVRDTIVLDANGSLTGVTDTFTQAVPEIDASSLAGAFPLMVGGLALLERRRRRGGEQAASTGC